MDDLVYPALHHAGPAEVTIRDLEELLGIEKEHLTFTIWYLREKSFVVRSDNGRFAITATGVDVYESAEAPLPLTTPVAQLQ